MAAHRKKPLTINSFDGILKWFDNGDVIVYLHVTSNYLESVTEKPNVKWNVWKVEFVLEKEPEKLLSCKYPAATWKVDGCTWGG